MAVTEKLTREINWKIWGGVAVTVIVIAGALGYWFDWFGGGETEAVIPAVEEAAPATE